MAFLCYPSTLALISFISILTFTPSTEATVCTFLPFLCRSPPPPSITGGSPFCRFLPLLCRTPPPPPPSPPPPRIGGSPFISTFITGTLVCPFSSEAPRFTLLRNAFVDLRCSTTGSGGTATTTSLATTTTNDDGNYVISLDITATSRLDLNTCVLVITSRGNVCLQAQIPSVPLRVLAVDQGVVILTSPIFGN